ncbi:MAG: hypothetical protein DRR08_09175 [Candidatus Parabeggiatoa sp. nov. 2]|nr:MAG: hypothetical protein B6247_26730 [Beggiatoa sp. 4572_84]RKZ61276.1 MAG: hypothetical protein DRR08_09175 [Gammaproteobacteria bacterium]
MLKQKQTTRGTDEAFLKLMAISGSSLLKLLGVPPKQADKYHFRAVTLKEKHIKPDVEAIPKLKSKEGPVFVEFQAYSDPFIRYRLAASVFLGCTQQQHKENVIAGIVYSDKEYQKAALPLSKVATGSEKDYLVKNWIKEVVLTKYTEQELLATDPKLIVLAPFTLPTTTDKTLVLEKGQEWGHKIGKVFPSQQQREALDILGLFVLNRFRQLKYEEVIAMLNFDLMDSVAGRQVYEMGHQNGIIEDARKKVIEVLDVRFGMVPTDVTEQILAISQPDDLTELHKQAVKCFDTEIFKEMLSKAVSSSKPENN